MLNMKPILDIDKVFAGGTKTVRWIKLSKNKERPNWLYVRGWVPHCTLQFGRQSWKLDPSRTLLCICSCQLTRITSPVFYFSVVASGSVQRFLQPRNLYIQCLYRLLSVWEVLWCCDQTPLRLPLLHREGIIQPLSRLSANIWCKKGWCCCFSAEDSFSMTATQDPVKFNPDNLYDTMPLVTAPRLPVL